MKTKLSLTLLILALSPVPLALSQIPQGFNYQAIARDGSGNILPNTPLQAMMYVQSLSTGGTIFWKELHSSITTNSFGLFTLVVGSGTRQTESTVATFNLIDWSVTPKYLKTEIYYSGSWKDMGTSQLMSVPYAMTSGDLAGTVDKLAVKGTTSGMEDALFEVKNKDGQTVFAVYNEGVRIYVSDGAKAVKGGFAVGGFGTDKAESAKYLFVGKDSVRVYLDTNPLTKKLKGGFAVGGYDITKGTVQDYLDVNSDSVRIYIDSNPATKKLKGGFAVGGYDMTKGDGLKFFKVTPDSTRIVTSDTLKGFGISNLLLGKAENYLKLTPSNYFIGHQSGKKITSGVYNSIMGFQSGSDMTTGFSNVLLGYQAGKSSNGNCNVSIGYQAGYKTTINADPLRDGSRNVFIGYQAGLNVTTGMSNIMIGMLSGYNYQAGEGNIFIGFQSGSGLDIGVPSGQYNTYIGHNVGAKSVSGDYNVYLGAQAGIENRNSQRSVVIGGACNFVFTGTPRLTSLDDNVYIGFIAAGKNTSGTKNTMIGSGSGVNSTGSSNVFIGYNSGYYETGSNKLFIDNQQRASEADARTKALIYGVFDASPANQSLTINGNVGIGTIAPGQKLDIVAGNGRVQTGYSWLTNSDARFKKNIYTLADCIKKVMAMRGVSFDLISDSLNIITDRKNIGFIAQELEKVVPEVVVTGSDGYKSVAYDKITAVLTEAIKEQQQQIESTKQENQQLKSQLQSLQEKVDKIDNLLAKALGE